MQVTHRTVVIREVADGWIREDTGRRYRTAVQAQRSVARQDKKIVQENPNAVAATTIEWVVTSRVGLLVAKALSS